MANVQDLSIEDPAYSVHKLTPEHIEPLQRLFEKCADYVLLVDGQAVSPTAAEETLQAAPPGRSLDDKLLYGLLDRNGEIVGLLEGMRHYPDEPTWWIGLLLLAPEVRGHGLGRRLVESFSEYARSEEGQSIMLGVVQENQAAYEFWQRLGFEVVRQTEPRPFGNKVQVVYVMRRQLQNDTISMI